MRYKGEVLDGIDEVVGFGEKRHDFQVLVKMSVVSKDPKKAEKIIEKLVKGMTHKAVTVGLPEIKQF